ncbi:MAG: 2TM domain-containing protein [Chitinophagaceae bacterium]|nr:2TM domain-containing protein [Chitinophagaceae bacterium]
MYTPPPSDKEPQLWEIAQKRAAFKSHLATYLVVNAFIWGIWYFTNRHTDHNGFPWPVWPTFGWGIGLFFHFLGAYVFPKSNSVEREYDKLTRNKG